MESKNLRHPAILLLTLIKIFGGFPYRIKFRETPMDTATKIEEGRIRNGRVTSRGDVLVERSVLATLWSALVVLFMATASIVFFLEPAKKEQTTCYIIRNIITNVFGVTPLTIQLYIFTFNPRLMRLASKLVRGPFSMEGGYFQWRFMKIYLVLFFSFVYISVCQGVLVYGINASSFYEISVTVLAPVILFLVYIGHSLVTCVGLLYVVFLTLISEIERITEMFKSNLPSNSISDEEDNMVSSLWKSVTHHAKCAKSNKTQDLVPASHFNNTAQPLRNTSLDIDAIMSSLTAVEEVIKILMTYEEMLLLVISFNYFLSLVTLLYFVLMERYPGGVYSLLGQIGQLVHLLCAPDAIKRKVRFARTQIMIVAVRRGGG